MSMSTESRLHNALTLLQLLYVALSDSPIDCTAFHCTDAIYISIHNTSWDELFSEGLAIKRGDHAYFLTAKGWSEALFRYGEVSDAGFQERLGKLSQTLKNRVKDCTGSVMISLEEVTMSSGLPSGWVFNAIDSHLLCRISGRRDAGWIEGSRGRMLEIPRDFGLIEIDLFADLRAENAKLSETVERMEVLYADFRCSWCSAPLILRTPWEHEYGSDEIMEYACGMTIGAPHGDAPCTQDPKFPKFEDFTLVTKYEDDRWWCFAREAKPNSPASSVHLFRTSGKTEDKAKEAMHKQYATRAMPWSG